MRKLQKLSSNSYRADCMQPQSDRELITNGIWFFSFFAFVSICNPPPAAVSGGYLEENCKHQMTPIDRNLNNSIMYSPKWWHQFIPYAPVWLCRTTICSQVPEKQKEQSRWQCAFNQKWKPLRSAWIRRCIKLFTGILIHYSDKPK